MLNRGRAAWMSCGISLLAAAAAVAEGARATAEGAWPRWPDFKVTEVIPTPTGADGQPVYAAFPALQPRPNGRWLVTYKAGQGHAWDPGAVVRTLLLDLPAGTVTAGQEFTPPAPLLYQCAEPVRFADGSSALFIDTQRTGPEPRHYRAPMRWARSPAGREEYGQPAVFPTVDGVQYGYPFEGVTVEGTTYLLVMTFGYLEGGRWSVDVLATADSGSTWRRVANLSEHFGVPGFNEGTLLPWDGGFLVASRSYDQRARLHAVDADFRLRHQVNLTESSAWVNGYIGRPRWVTHRGSVYLLGRNWTQPTREPEPGSPLLFPPEQQLCLFKVDPVTLELLSCWILDNAEGARVTDGYYAVAATTGEAEDERLHVITYKGVQGRRPELVRLEFKWKELR